jgi:hypothetical protein
MGSVFSAPKPPTIIQAAAPAAEVTTPSTLPDKNSYELRKQAAAKTAQMSEEGTSAADTQLTTSKLGDVAKAYRRFGSSGSGSGSSPTIVG